MENNNALPRVNYAETTSIVMNTSNSLDHIVGKLGEILTTMMMIDIIFFIKSFLYWHLFMFSSPSLLYGRPINCWFIKIYIYLLSLHKIFILCQQVSGSMDSIVYTESNKIIIVHIHLYNIIKHDFKEWYKNNYKLRLLFAMK